MLRMLATCVATVRSESTSVCEMPSLKRPSAMSSRTSRSRAVSRPSGFRSRWRATSRVTMSGVDDRFAGGEPAQRTFELFEIGDAVLEQVTHSFWSRRDERDRVCRLQVLGQYEHRGFGSGACGCRPRRYPVAVRRRGGGVARRRRLRLRSRIRRRGLEQGWLEAAQCRLRGSGAWQVGGDSRPRAGWALDA